MSSLKTIHPLWVLRLKKKHEMIVRRLLEVNAYVNVEANHDSAILTDVQK